MRGRSLSTFCLVLLYGCFLTACNKPEATPYQPTFSSTPPDTETVYLFGVHPLHNPQHLYKVFGPLMDYLSEKIAGVRFKLEASRNYAAYDKKLYAHKFHFSLPNPYQTINAVDKGYRVFAKMGDDNNFRGIILVRRDSDIRQVSDLSGKAVSYPAPTALAATMMPQYYLQTHGVDVMQELDNRYVGSQESSVMNVYLKQTAAAATWPPPWLALAKQRPELKKELKVIWETEPLINNGLVVSPDVPATIVQQVHDLLVNLHTHQQGREILEPMELSRFESANDDSYRVVRDFIDNFARQVRPLNGTG
ncbi:MAG: phosphonate ABC transporter substrate-binding protein [gamma proteobacterium symbiont of Ctena orbiculata]|nr:MAG: phosphonate ABC transporter substrate-binding protein [gamma proteobacterium symbiont of Ctena orbiculata]PVV18976.1 MAG: phosphonate ABC transporter substrate-binding protein [gamma proteobacterium symbiont of Ctena orbiculata]PVV27273.1 MAG: phosphonate ABC transporter substrate-binding protein [gamma proteobacterium symbiont of Ctena orbiculata]